MQEKKYDAIIFDLDGTLLNTLEDLTDSVNFALEKYGMPLRTLDEIRHMVGNGVQKLLRRAVPTEATDEECEKVFAEFKNHYAEHCNDKTNLYPGIRELLKQLKELGFHMAIVSNKLQEGVDALSEQYFKEYVMAAIGAKDGMKKKPAPDGTYEAMNILNAEKERCVYVGDSEVDIATAANAGIDCIAVGWGFRSREEQIAAGGSVFIDKPEDMIKLLYQ